jgi:hypothetical protein
VLAGEVVQQSPLADPCPLRHRVERQGHDAAFGHQLAGDVEKALLSDVGLPLAG